MHKLTEIDKEREYKQNNNQLTSIEKEEEIINKFKENEWNISNCNHTLYGQIFDNYIGKNVFYNIIKTNDISVVIISKEKIQVISDNIKIEHSETNQIFSWLYPYNKLVKYYKFNNFDTEIDILIC